VKIKSQKDFFSGVMFAVVGGAFAIGATTYQLGDGAKMGPGYFPLLLGIILAILGAIICVTSMTKDTPDGDPIGSWAWRPLVCVIGANLIFGVLLGGLPSLGIPSMGLMVGIYVLTFVSALGSSEFRFKEVFILATILAVGSYGAFIFGLKLQFPVWPSFIS
jgi:hypothetical protein